MKYLNNKHKNEMISLITRQVPFLIALLIVLCYQEKPSTTFYQVWSVNYHLRLIHRVSSMLRYVLRAALLPSDPLLYVLSLTANRIQSLDQAQEDYVTYLANV